jgi:hypothetical protein
MDVSNVLLARNEGQQRGQPLLAIHYHVAAATQGIPNTGRRQQQLNCLIIGNIMCCCGRVVESTEH